MLSHTEVRNPISLAKLILDRSNIPLSLRRVPPNILIGSGAKIFASKNGLAIMANEFLVSKNARDRFLRWQDDLRRAEEKARVITSPLKIPEKTTRMAVECQFDTFSPVNDDQVRTDLARRQDHAMAIQNALWNEGQPDSPYHGSPAPSVQGESQNLNISRSAPTAAPETNVQTGKTGRGRTPSPFRSKREYTTSSTVHFRNRTKEQDLPEAHRDGSASPLRPSPGAVSHLVGASLDIISPSPRSARRSFLSDEELVDEDLITDTVGAIAIDDEGRIAAGSSSGGIGMKHRGRLGPAALVNIGTAVIPSHDATDTNAGMGPSVATVSSGTGEHMATTMASWRCAQRIMAGKRMSRYGDDVSEDDEDVIMESFVSDDFMNHPGVKNCHSIGAIGVMTVKRTTRGYHLYFAHNTDSFALASMSSADREPNCVMSRLGETNKVARGGRMIRAVD